MYVVVWMTERFGFGLVCVAGSKSVAMVSRFGRVRSACVRDCRDDDARRNKHSRRTPVSDGSRPAGEDEQSASWAAGIAGSAGQETAPPADDTM